ncbi:MAG: hypothetical protein K8H88_06435, partial [Sandaracinaceae bacterium]|nr:hypothetical protein [Sandaracinaceae bacterium]
VVRDRLDARAADIVACAGRDRVAVRVSWAVDGSLDVRLQGPLAGSPEEGCVQDLLEGARAPSEGRAGVVVHLVRAPPPGG